MSATKTGACQAMSCWRLAVEGSEFCEEHGWQEDAPANGSNGHVEVDGLGLLERMDAGEPVANNASAVAELPEPEEAPDTPAATAPRSVARTGRGELQRLVLTALADGHTKAHSIAQTLGRTDSALISAALTTLVRKGLVEKTGYGTYGSTIEGREALQSGRSLDAGRDASKKPAERQQPPQARVRVKGTGLSYRSPEETYVAAEEIEADRERVAGQARFDGDEGKAEKARDQSRELAEKIRDAAHAAEARAGHADSTYEPPAALEIDSDSALPEPEPESDPEPPEPDPEPSDEAPADDATAAILQLLDLLDLLDADASYHETLVIVAQSPGGDGFVDPEAATLFRLLLRNELGRYYKTDIGAAVLSRIDTRETPA